MWIDSDGRNEERKKQGSERSPISCRYYLTRYDTPYLSKAPVVENVSECFVLDVSALYTTEPIFERRKTKMFINDSAHWQKSAFQFCKAICFIFMFTQISTDSRKISVQNQYLYAYASSFNIIYSLVVYMEMSKRKKTNDILLVGDLVPSCPFFAGTTQISVVRQLRRTVGIRHPLMECVVVEIFPF